MNDVTRYIETDIDKIRFETQGSTIANPSINQTAQLKNRRIMSRSVIEGEDYTI